jgi:hypothetical protein
MIRNLMACFAGGLFIALAMSAQQSNYSAGGSSISGNPASMTGTAASSGSAVGSFVDTSNAYTVGDIIFQIRNNGSPILNIERNASQTELVAPAGTLLLMCAGTASSCAQNFAANVNGTASFVVTSGTVQQLTITSLADSNTAPTISSGFGTSPSIPSANGTASFTVNVGTGGIATSGVLTMPAATHGWSCMFSDQTTPVKGASQTANTTTSVTVTATAAWTASDILLGICRGN